MLTGPTLVHCTKEVISKINDENYFEMCKLLAVLLPQKLYEQLYQLVKNPTWDGNIISKSERDDLIELGIAIRICANGEQGYTGAKYIGYSILKAAKEMNIYKPEETP